MINKDKAFWDMVKGNLSGHPTSKLLGWKCLNIDTEKGTIEVEFQPRKDFLNPAGFVQGGLVAAMLDDTMGPIVYATLEEGEFNPSIEFKVNFIRPVKIGKVIAKAHIIYRGKSIAFVESELRNTDGQLLATATGTMKIVHAQTGFGEFKE